MKAFIFMCTLTLLTPAYAQAPGDFNCDDRVDNADLNELLGAWTDRPILPIPGHPCLSQYDLPIDNGELNDLLGNWGFGTGAGATSIPEPNTLGLLLCGLTISLRSRRTTRNRT